MPSITSANFRNLPFLRALVLIVIRYRMPRRTTGRRVAHHRQPMPLITRLAHPFKLAQHYSRGP